MRDYLREQILKSGYPLEVEIHSILERNWFVTHNAYFLDEEQNKTRLLDMHAVTTPTFKDQDESSAELPNFSALLNLAVECKKSDEYAWIFFTVPSYLRLLGYGQYFDHTKAFRQDAALDLYFDNPDSLFHYYSFEKVASSFLEVKLEKSSGKRREPREIYEGVSELVKFVSYQIQSHSSSSRRRYEECERTTDIWKPMFEIIYYFPVLVYQGQLYEALFEDGRIQLEERNHLLLERYYRPPYSQTPLAYRIDIVKSGFFPQFIKIIERDVEWFHSQLIRNRDEIVRTIDEFQDAHGKRALLKT